MIQGATYTVHIGNNLDILPTLPDNSVDSIVTDPPYELGFMGKQWDSSGIAYSVELWTECLRVLKPGGHLLAFSGSRTYHRMVVAIEDSGFEIRDMVSWISNKTFPKSLDISKAIDKAARVNRKVLGIDKIRGNGPSMFGRTDPNNPEYDGSTVGVGTTYITEPATEEAKIWHGWGTGLKPTVEPIVMARKPIIGTVAQNVITYGTGGINIDVSRISTDDRFGGGAKGSSGFAANYESEGWTAGNDLGRWPANVIFDETAAVILDKQANANVSRFFYVPKATKSDRNDGLDQVEGKELGAKGNGLARTCAICGASILKPCECENRTFVNPTRKNFHPTVKPTDLMRYLIKLVTPPGGTVLDPFTGSGSTGKAAILEGFRFIGCELTKDYVPIIEGRLKHAELKFAEMEAKKEEGLF
jgi:site-specific DNA-methyltransferase (adenine-specific)